MIKEHDRVVLTAPVPADHLEVGDVGTVVHVYPDGKAFEVEFMTLDGQTVTVVTTLRNTGPSPEHQRPGRLHSTHRAPASFQRRPILPFGARDWTLGLRNLLTPAAPAAALPAQGRCPVFLSDARAASAAAAIGVMF
jgi:hypothetical protein